jgi:uncharacterized LabA/DUF88 family protein
MAHNVGVFVDVSNLFYSAKSAGVEVNYCRLLDCAVAGRDLIRASAYTGVDPDNANQRKFIDFLRANGYKVICKDIHKYEGGRIKANLDIEMAVDIMLLSENLDVVVLVSGDGDFVRLLEAIQLRGVRCEVISFGISTSNELIEVADQFTEITSLPGIFRNAASGPSIHVRSVQGTGSDLRGVYTYGAVSYQATFGPHEDRRPPSTVHRPPSAQMGQGHHPASYDHADNSEFMLPDGEPCIDTHSIPLPRPARLGWKAAAGTDE